MTFEQLVGKLVAEFDVTQAAAVDVVNERLSLMVTSSKALRAVISLGNTVALQTSYTLPSNVAKVLKVWVAFTAGTTSYEGSATLEDFVDFTTGDADTDGYWYATEPDADSDMNTESLRLYPPPSEAGKAINALVALRPSTITYASATALPIPIDQHGALLDGCRAELADGDDRQDLSAKWEGNFQQGVNALEGATSGRAKGTGRHRIKVSGYDIAR